MFMFNTLSIPQSLPRRAKLWHHISFIIRCYGFFLKKWYQSCHFDHVYQRICFDLVQKHPPSRLESRASGVLGYILYDVYCAGSISKLKRVIIIIKFFICNTLYSNTNLKVSQAPSKLWPKYIKSRLYVGHYRPLKKKKVPTWTTRGSRTKQSTKLPSAHACI